MSGAATGWTGGLAVRIIFAAIVEAAAGAARAGRVVLPTRLRADFDAVATVARALLVAGLAPFLTVRRAVLVDPRAVFAECVLIHSI